MTRKLFSIEFARKLENNTADLADEIENEIHDVSWRGWRLTHVDLIFMKLISTNRQQYTFKDTEIFRHKFWSYNKPRLLDSQRSILSVWKNLVILYWSTIILGQNQFVYGKTAAKKEVQIVLGGVEMEDRLILTR